MAPVLALACWYLTRGEPAETPAWRIAGLIIAVLVLAYLAEEIIWNVQGKGRPCIHCGAAVPIRSFRVHLVCPHCGKKL